MKTIGLVIAWCFIAFAVVTAFDNLFLQPAIPGQFVGGADLVFALMFTIVLLDRAYHVFDIRK